MKRKYFLLIVFVGIILSGKSYGQITLKHGKIKTSLEQGNHVFAVFSKKSFSDKEEVTKVLRSLQKDLNGKVEIINIDLTNPVESKLIKMLNIDENSTQTITLVINPQGKATGQFRGVPDRKDLLSKVIKTGCSTKCSK